MRNTCGYCEHYRFTANDSRSICTKTMKEVGFLWVRECFNTTDRADKNEILKSGEKYEYLRNRDEEATNNMDGKEERRVAYQEKKKAAKTLPRINGKVFRGENLMGQKFHRLTVVGWGYVYGNKVRKWECRCECGGTTYTTAFLLKTGGSKSCGCLRKEVLATANRNGTYRNNSSNA